MSGRRAGVLAAIAAALLGACSIQVDSSPREVPPEREEALLPDTPEAAGAPAGGDDRIYLRSPDNPDNLRTVPRTVDGTEELFTVLLAGPNDEERVAGVGTAIPGGVELNSVTIRGNVVTIDVSAELRGTPSETIIAVAQIVHTANLVVDGTAQVVIRVDGERAEWPDISGASRSGPLTVYDFYGLAESSQPAYPRLPSPQPPSD